MMVPDSSGLSSANEFMGKMDQAMDLYARCKEVTEKRKTVEAWSKVKITETVAKYKACQDLLNHTFGERDKALSKYYELLDKAVDSGENIADRGPAAGRTTLRISSQAHQTAHALNHHIQGPPVFVRSGIAKA